MKIHLQHGLDEVESDPQPPALVRCRRCAGGCVGWQASPPAACRGRGCAELQRQIQQWQWVTGAGRQGACGACSASCSMHSAAGPAQQAQQAAQRTLHARPLVAVLHHNVLQHYLIRSTVKWNASPQSRRLLWLHFRQPAKQQCAWQHVRQGCSVPYNLTPICTRLAYTALWCSIQPNPSALASSDTGFSSGSASAFSNAIRFCSFSASASCSRNRAGWRSRNRAGRAAQDAHAMPARQPLQLHSCNGCGTASPRGNSMTKK